MLYNIPNKYKTRLHHVRPRFKGNVEGVLIFMAEKIASLEKMPSKNFAIKMNEFIKMFPGNQTKSEKTINNWRTEISSLFGFIQYEEEGSKAKPSLLAIQLAKTQDLVQFFKYFLYYFQYPGAHLKSDRALELIKSKVKLNPARYILKLLKQGEENGKRFFITKAELTHCIFNDLRVLTGKVNIGGVLKKIQENRRLKYEYDWSGDTIRYGGDILDYMVLANLLEIKGGRYIINQSEPEAVSKFLTDENLFEEYDELYKKQNVTAKQVTEKSSQWFDYVNSDLSENLFKTDIAKFVGIEEKVFSDLINTFVSSIEDKKELEFHNTKDIGDMGESLVFGHECMRLKKGEREDLVHLVQRIPTKYAVGYDIQSVELDEKKRYIEVKTTISSNKLNFFNLHLTPNEWNVAESVKDRYYIYRLLLSKQNQELFIIQDPVKKYKEDQLQMSPRNGADITFNDRTGNREQLLIWNQ